MRLPRAALAVVCDAYATKAFSAAKAISEFNCGFQGPRWLLDENAHRFWCLIVPEPTAQGETGAREAQIKGCTCNWYADTAMAQIADNKARNCGFGGLRWLDSRRGHYDWCNVFNPGLPAMKGENNTRAAMLQHQC
jgi:hypothetical protein